MTPNLPGKRLANGRKAALECLDCFMAEEKNIQKLREAFQVEFDICPVEFFQKTIAPLMTQSMLGDESMDDDTKKEMFIAFLREANLSIVGFDMDKTSDTDTDTDSENNGDNGHH